MVCLAGFMLLQTLIQEPISPGLLAGSRSGRTGPVAARPMSRSFGLLPHERAQAMFLFAQMWENILENPLVFASALGQNFWEYLKNMPSFLFEGYSPGYHVSSRFALIAVLTLLACLFLVHRGKSSRTERLFWVFLFISVFLSASIVLGGDGWRVLHVTHALIACFFAAGFTAPAVVVAGATPAWRWQTGATIIAAMTVLFLAVPALSHALAREFAVRSAAVSQARPAYRARRAAHRRLRGDSRP